MGYDFRRTRIDDDVCQKLHKPDRKSYEKNAIPSTDYLGHMRMSDDGCPNDVPKYVVDRKR